MSHKCKHCSEYKDACMDTCEGWQDEDKLRNQMQALMIENANLKREVSDLLATHLPNMCKIGHKEIRYGNVDEVDYADCPLCQAINELHSDEEYRNEMA